MNGTHVISARLPPEASLRYRAQAVYFSAGRSASWTTHATVAGDNRPHDKDNHNARTA